MLLKKVLVLQVKEKMVSYPFVVVTMVILVFDLELADLLNNEVLVKVIVRNVLNKKVYVDSKIILGVGKVILTILEVINSVLYQED